MAECIYRGLGSGICEKICEECVFTYNFLINLNEEEAKKLCDDFEAKKI